MEKIKSLDDLRKKQQLMTNQINLREKSADSSALVQIKVAMATCGISAGARNIMNLLLVKITDEQLPVVVTQTGCMGYCHAEPTVEVHKPGEEPVVFGNVTVERAAEIIDKYVKYGELLDDIIPVNYEKLQ